MSICKTLYSTPNQHITIRGNAYSNSKLSDLIDLLIGGNCFKVVAKRITNPYPQIYWNIDYCFNNSTMTGYTDYDLSQQIDPVLYNNETNTRPEDWINQVIVIKDKFGHLSINYL